jgi:hypothetical protein
VLVELDVDDALALAGAVDEAGDAAVAVGSGDQADVWGVLLDLVAEVLGHAAGDAEDQARSLFAVAQELAGAAVDAVFGLLADGAGVEEDDVGGGGVGRRGRSRRRAAGP